MPPRFFRLSENKTTVKTEVLAGATTFMTMSYIIFVQPIVLSIAGMDVGSVMVATCISSAIGTILMGLLANYPIALAPAMGHNFFFAITVVTILHVPWQVALGATFIAGIIFVIISLFGMREAIINSVPDALKNAIAVGIGLLIALVGLEWGGIVVAAPGTLVTVGKMTSPPVLLCLFGLAVMAILFTLKIRGAIIIGIIAGALAGLPFGLTSYHGIFSAPPSLKPTFLALDIPGALDVSMISVIFIFLFLALFDTVGTLIGVSQKAGFIGPDGRLPRARRALVADSLSILFGAALGTSTVTSYIESATGVSEGGRTGLSNMVTALLLLAALFVSPLVMMIGGGYTVSDTTTLYPAIAPALIFVGSLMLTLVSRINWEEAAEAFPAFLTIIFMPLTVSITEGISVGFISWTLLAFVTRRLKKEHTILYVFAILFVVRYVFLTY